MKTIYSCGLRISEGVHLQVRDVDSARMTLLIHGKGKKDRYVPLPSATLVLLRAQWRTHRHPTWLFPAPLRINQPIGVNPLHQKRALSDIENCRTPFFGGHVHQCDHCDGKRYSYHSCRNRSCPKCHQDQTERWISKQRERLPPCPYYLVTFTLPAELHAVARSNRKTLYGLLMKAAADALQKLARDPRYLGARIGILAVLHTWTRALLFHPHVHMLVTARGPRLRRGALD